MIKFSSRLLMMIILLVHTSKQASHLEMSGLHFTTLQYLMLVIYRVTQTHKMSILCLQRCGSSLIHWPSVGSICLRGNNTSEAHMVISSIRTSVFPPLRKGRGGGLRWNIMVCFMFLGGIECLQFKQRL